MSKRIKELYKKAGIKAPNGKGVHSFAFHNIATSIKRDNPSYSMSRCYKIAMGTLGRNKSVNPSHRRNPKRKEARRKILGGK